MRDRHRKAMVAKTYRRVLASSFCGGGLKLDASFIEVSPEPPDYSEWIPSRKREFQPISLKAEGGRRKHPTAFRLLHTSPCLLAYYGHKHFGRTTGEDTDYGRGWVYWLIPGGSISEARGRGLRDRRPLHRKP